MINFDESEFANKSCLEIFDGLMSSADGDEELALKNADEIINNSDGYNEELSMARDALHALVQNKRKINMEEAVSSNDIDKMTEHKFLPALNEQAIYLDEDDNAPVRIFYRNYTEKEDGTKDKTSPSIVAYEMKPNLKNLKNGRRWKTTETQISLGDTYDEQLEIVKYALFNVYKNDELLNEIVLHPLGMSYPDPGKEDDAYNEELDNVKSKNKENKEDYNELIDKNVLYSTVYRKAIERLDDKHLEDDKFMHKLKSLISMYKYRYDMNDDSIMHMLVLQKMIPSSKDDLKELNKYADDELFNEILDELQESGILNI